MPQSGLLSIWTHVRAAAKLLALRRTTGGMNPALYLSGVNFKRTLWRLSLLLFFPTSCQANAGIGLFLIVVPLIVITLPIVVIIEAIYMRYRLALTWRRAFGISTLANVISTLLGVVFGIGIDLALFVSTGSSGFEPTRIAASIILVPMFYLTIRIEYKVWRWRDKTLVERGLARSVLLAHVLSYALLYASVWSHGFFLDEETLSVKMRLYRKIESLEPSQQMVADFAAQHHRLPRAGELKDVQLDRMGRLSLLLNEAALPQGSKVWITGELADDFSVHWHCSIQAPDPQVLDRNYARLGCPSSPSFGQRRKLSDGFESK